MKRVFLNRFIELRMRLLLYSEHYRWVRIFLIPVAFLLPIVAVEIFGLNAVYQAMTESGIVRQEAVVDLSSRIIYERLNGLQELGTALAGRPLVIKYITNERWQDAVDNLKGNMESFPSINRFFLTDPRGTIRADSLNLRHATGFSRAHTDWYKAVSRNWQPVISDVFKRSSLPARNVIDIAVPVKSDGHPLGAAPVAGVLVLQIELRHLSDWVNKFNLAKNETFTILDRQGNIVYHPRIDPKAAIVRFDDRSDKDDLGRSVFSVQRTVDRFGWKVVLQAPSGTIFFQRDDKVRSILIISSFFLVLTYLLFVLIFTLFESNRSRNKRIRDLYDHAPCAYHSLDKDGKYLFVNETELSWLGLKRDDVVGKVKFSDHLTPESRQKYQNMFSVFVRQGYVEQMEFDMIGSDGKIIAVLLNGYAVRDKNGDFLMSRTSMLDITDRKKVEEDLRMSYKNLKETEAQLLQADKLSAIGQLAAGVAHEINNPVGFISNNIELLGQYFTDYTRVLKMYEHLRVSVEEGNIDQAKEILRDIAKLSKEIQLERIISDSDNLIKRNHKGIDRIKRIVMDLRTFAREDQDTMELVKVEDVIDSVLSIVHHEFKYKADLKKSYSDTPLVRANTQRLGQVLINLFINAAQAIEKKGMVEVKTYTQGQYLCIEVRDTGKGISPEHLKKIFEPFFTTKPVGQGTGLGLSISYEIIKKHGGDIQVRSKLNEGSTFTIFLPVEQRGEA